MYPEAQVEQETGGTLLDARKRYENNLHLSQLVYTRQLSSKCADGVKWHFRITASLSCKKPDSDKTLLEKEDKRYQIYYKIRVNIFNQIKAIPCFWNIASSVLKSLYVVWCNRGFRCLWLLSFQLLLNWNNLFSTPVTYHGSASS